MTGIRFIHSSDLHLGKPFGRFEDDIRADLRLARAGLISRLIDTARAQGVQHILLAGDTFDQETPSLRLIRQTISAMAEASDLQWWIIPGNHDSLTADLIWQTFATYAPETVRVLRDPTPVKMSETAYLLPAPCPRRSAGFDLTEAMSQAETPPEACRIGLAHGGVVDFRPDEPSADTIPPDRAELSRLDYLALGDWHGALQVTPRTHYSGTPERDRFKHSGPGVCLLVSVDHPGALPEVTPLPLGQYDWQEIELAISPGIDAVAALMAGLPTDRADWRNYLIKLTLRGYAHLDQRIALLDKIAEIQPEFCHFETQAHGLQTEYQPDDLDQIARGGALRLAAEALQHEANAPELAQADRDVADAALTRLYTLVKEVAQ